MSLRPALISLVLLVAFGPCLNGGGAVIGRALSGERNVPGLRGSAISDMKKAAILQEFLDITCDEEASAIHKVKTVHFIGG